MIKAIIFDFYGVLYSNLDWEAIDERIYSDETKKKEFRSYIVQANSGEISNEEFLRHVSRLAKDKDYVERPVVNSYSNLNLVVVGMIEDLKTRYKIGLLSNGGREHIINVFNEIGGIDKYFDAVMTSTDTHSMKPDKRAFVAIIKKLKVGLHEALVIDDSIKHISGADKLGLATILFKDMKQLRQEFINRRLLNA